MATPLNYMRQVMPPLSGNYPLVPTGAGLPEVIPPNAPIPKTIPVNSAPRVPMVRPPAGLPANIATPAAAGVGDFLAAANVAALPASFTALTGQASMAAGNAKQKQDLAMHPITFADPTKDQISSSLGGAGTFPNREAMARRNDVMGISKSASDAWRAPEPWPKSKHEVYVPPAKAPPSPVREPLKPVAPLNNTPAPTPKQEPQMPVNDHYGENAMMKQIGAMNDLAGQARWEKQNMADRIGALDISGKSAPFLGQGVISAGLDESNQANNTYMQQAGHIAQAMPSLHGAITQDAALPDLAEGHKYKALFDENTEKGKAEIEALKGHAKYWDTAHSAAKPQAMIAEWQNELLKRMPQAERDKLVQGTLANHNPKQPVEKVDWGAVASWPDEAIQAEIIKAHNLGDTATAAGLAHYLKNKPK